MNAITFTVTAAVFSILSWMDDRPLPQWPPKTECVRRSWAAWHWRDAVITYAAEMQCYDDTTRRLAETLARDSYLWWDIAHLQTPFAAESTYYAVDRVGTERRIVDQIGGLRFDRGQLPSLPSLR